LTSIFGDDPDFSGTRVLDMGKLVNTYQVPGAAYYLFYREYYLKGMRITHGCMGGELHRAMLILEEILRQQALNREFARGIAQSRQGYTNTTATASSRRSAPRTLFEASVLFEASGVPRRLVQDARISVRAHMQALGREQKEWAVQRDIPTETWTVMLGAA
jgi:hypothetical protein